MGQRRITKVDFLNKDTFEESIGRLGMSALHNGVSPEAIAVLVRLTCQAHGVQVVGLHTTYDETLLKELASISLIFWREGAGKVSMV